MNQEKQKYILKRIKALNFGGLQNIEVDFNDRITNIVGVNGSGKTSILKAFVAAIKGISKKNEGRLVADRYTILGNNASSDVLVELQDVKTKDIITFKNHIVRSSGNNIMIEAPEGYPISDEWAMNLFNVSMVSPRYFAMLNPKEQALALGVDVSEYNKEIKEAEDERRYASRELKKYEGVVEVEKVEKVDVQALNEDKNRLRVTLNEQCKKNQEHNRKLREEYLSEGSIINEYNSQITSKKHEVKHWLEALNAISAEVKDCTSLINDVEAYKTNLKPKALPEEPKYIEEMPDSTALDKLDKKIAEASDINVQASKYDEYIQKVKLREEAKRDWECRDAEVKRLRNEKIQYVKEYNFPFDALEVNDSGELLLNGRYINYDNFSSGEMAVIVAQLHASLDPELKIMFIDDFELLDDDNQEKLLNELGNRGWQLLLAMVGKESKGVNSVLIKEGRIVDSYTDKSKPSLV